MAPARILHGAGGTHFSIVEQGWGLRHFPLNVSRRRGTQGIPANRKMSLPLDKVTHHRNSNSLIYFVFSFFFFTIMPINSFHSTGRASFHNLINFFYRRKMWSASMKEYQVDPPIEKTSGVTSIHPENKKVIEVCDK